MMNGIRQNRWYQEGTTGHRERNDIVTYENGIEVARELA
ncbi:MAG: G5 domain-containing protein [Coprococcus sp.]